MRHAWRSSSCAAASAIERQKPLPLTYKGQRLDCGYRFDLLVEGAVIVEVKSIEKLERVHFAQLLSYLRFASCQVGLLVNFNVAVAHRETGIKRVVHDVSRVVSSLCVLRVLCVVTS